MKNNKQQSAPLDLFTPIYEIFHELCMLFAEVFVTFAKFTFRKWREYHGYSSPISKIEQKALNVKKYTEVEDALGTDTKTGRDILLSDIDFKKHSFIVGASGFGKTNLLSILQENSLRQDKPIIFFDPKGDLQALETFKSICKKYDRTCHIFSEHYPDSISLNPILEGSINQVTDRIMSAFEWSEIYYQETARNALSNALIKLQSESREFTIKALVEILKLNADKDCMGLLNKLNAILVSDFGKILNSTGKGLTLSKIRDNKECLYIGLSTQGYGETAMAIGKLFLGELLYNSYKSLVTNNENKGLENPLSVHFDEFGSLVTSRFIELQNKCRGAGIELTMAVQTTADLDSISPTLKTQIVENAGNFFILKQRLSESAQYFAESIGTITSKKQTYKIEEGRQQSSGSEREVHELIVHSDIIKNLNIGQCILLRQGPSRVNLINIRNRKLDVAEKFNRLQSAKRSQAFN